MKTKHEIFLKIKPKSIWEYLNPKFWKRKRTLEKLLDHTLSKNKTMTEIMVRYEDKINSIKQRIKPHNPLTHETLKRTKSRSLIWSARLSSKLSDTPSSSGDPEA